MLTPDQLRAGDYVLPSELPLAQRLVEQGDWAVQRSSQEPDDKQLPGVKVTVSTQKHQQNKLCLYEALVAENVGWADCVLTLCNASMSESHCLNLKAAADSTMPI